MQSRAFIKCDIHARVEDSRGWIEYRTRTTENEAIHESAQRASLLYEDKIWTTVDPAKPVAVVMEHTPENRKRVLGTDLRYLGVGAVWFRETPQFASNAVDYAVSTEENRITVNCQVGAASKTYVFATDQGNNLVRIEERAEGHEPQILEIINQQYGEHWFPNTITCSRGEKWLSTVSVISAKFETAELPSTLRPIDIGIGLGTNLVTRDSGGRISPIRSYDGDAVIPIEEAVRRRIRDPETYPPSTHGRPHTFLPMQFDTTFDESQGED